MDNYNELEIKKNHHHVWAYYMRRWSPNGKNVFYTTKKNRRKIACDSVRNVAVDRNFYEIKLLEEKHVVVLKMLMSKSPDTLQELHRSLLDKLLYLQSGYELLLKSSNKNNNKFISNAYQQFKSNTLENLYSEIENSGKNIIDQLCDHNLSVLDDDKNVLEFMHFLSHQFTRTKNIYDNTKIVFENELNINISEWSKILEECWWLWAHMMGTNLGFSNYIRRNEANNTLLINASSTPFITSDQPVINVHPSLTDEFEILKDEQYDLYYPLSPSIAFIISNSKIFPKGIVNISEDVVDELNIKIAKKSNFHIIGNSEEALRSYCGYVGSWSKTMKNRR